ncbi:MAG: hypothetical protein JXQ99_04735 [Hyphomicrobiaceae bacterium]
MKQLDLSLDYAVFFLFDDDRKDVVFPEISGDLPVYSTQSVIGISAQAYVDGDVKVILCNHEELNKPEVKEVVESCKFRLQGKLDCPNATISLFDAGTNLFTFKTKKVLPDVKIWSNRDTYSDLILIAVDGEV